MNGQPRMKALPPASAPPATALLPRPDELRVADILRYQEDSDNSPRDLMEHCTLWLLGEERRQGQGSGYDSNDYAAAAYVLGHRDGEDDGDRAARGLDMALAWAGGFACALVMVAIGYLLSH